MRKIKRFRLEQNHVLSFKEMSGLNGGVDLVDYCTAENVGARCLYGGAGSHATGICTYVNNQSSNGSVTVIVTGYVCVKD